MQAVRANGPFGQEVEFCEAEATRHPFSTRATRDGESRLKPPGRDLGPPFRERDHTEAEQDCAAENEENT